MKYEKTSDEPIILRIRMTNTMLKKIVVTVLGVMLFASTQAGDFEDGVVAYEREDYLTAASHFTKAAEQGDSDAQYNLGLMYKSGKGVRQDEKVAFKWYKKAAEQGVASAQYILGLMYHKGAGVRQDERVAVKWYKKAAEQKHATAQYNLGVTYHNGERVRQDKSVAKEWFGKACDNGEQKGCDDYGKLNEAGY